jgi:hypothetical protein
VEAFAAVSFDRMTLHLGLYWEPVRWDAGPVDPTLEHDAIGARIGVVRVLDEGVNHRFELGVSALLTADVETFQTAEGEQVATGGDIRAGVFARLRLGASAVGGLVTLDAGCSPLRLGRSVRLDPVLPELPACGVALAAGAAWEG